MDINLTAYHANKSSFFVLHPCCKLLDSGNTVAEFRKYFQNYGTVKKHIQMLLIRNTRLYIFSRMLKPDIRQYPNFNSKKKSSQMQNVARFWS